MSNRSCFCDYSDADPPEFWIHHLRKARKEHRCDERSCIIEKGEHYHEFRGKWEGQISTIRVCLECENLREELNLFFCINDICYCSLYYALYEAIQVARDDGWTEEWAMQEPPPHAKEVPREDR